jgi:hypothetical protein
MQPSAASCRHYSALYLQLIERDFTAISATIQGVGAFLACLFAYPDTCSSHDNEQPVQLLSSTHSYFGEVNSTFDMKEAQEIDGRAPMRRR